MIPLLADVAALSPPAISAPAPEAPRWLARLSLGLGSVAPSAVSGTLTTDGYDAWLRTWALADAAWFFARPAGLGVWGGGAFRSSRPRDDAPRLVEREGFVGSALHLRSITRAGDILFTARVGYAVGAISLYGDGRAASTLAYGFELSFARSLSPFFSAGLSLGFLDAPVRAAPGGELGNNFGGVYLCITGSFHD
jgi:hypothetical protein